MFSYGRMHHWKRITRLTNAHCTGIQAGKDNYSYLGPWKIRDYEVVKEIGKIIIRDYEVVKEIGKIIIYFSHCSTTWLLKAVNLTIVLIMNKTSKTTLTASGP